MNKLPLEGIRVIDFSWIIAGPTCTRMLGMMGAEIIKIESHRRPDPTRVGGGGNFHFLNQSKTSLSLNLRTEEGVDIAKKLISISDVLVENYASGVIERIGLGYEDIKANNPNLIMVSSSGLGHSGPDKDHVAYGTLLQCFTGWSYQTGIPEKPPMIGGVWADPLTGMMQTFLVASCLSGRYRTGLGQYVDFSMAEANTTLLQESLMNFFMNKKIIERNGNYETNIGIHDLFPCKGFDSWIALVIENDEDWNTFCELSQIPELNKYNSNEKRLENRGQLTHDISVWTKQYNKFDLMEKLQANGIMCGASMDSLEVIENKHHLDRNFVSDYIHKDYKDIKLPNVPWTLNNAPETKITPAPELGSSNNYILHDLLGIEQKNIDKMVEEQIIY